MSLPAKRPDSDEFTGRTRWVYPEWRDREAALFVDKLPQGFWELRYEFRAETPGKFHALPVVAHTFSRTSLVIIRMT